ncbi:MAG: TonB-dependent receptor, partial [Chitinophagaceae bacterium]
MSARVSFLLIVLISFLSTFFFTTKAHAQNRVVGTVRSGATGEPVARVSIVIDDLHLGTQTDDSGKFVFPAGVRGIHLLEFSHIQYRSQMLQANFSEGDNMKVFLQPSVVENAAVVVTGVAKAADSRKLPFQVSVIKSEELRRQPALTVVDYLSKVPGVTSLQSGPAVQKPMIRGLGYNRVLVIHDGVRQEGQQWGDEHGLEVAGEGVEKIEVLKGPASLVYGSDAMAGVVNII